MRKIMRAVAGVLVALMLISHLPEMNAFAALKIGTKTKFNYYVKFKTESNNGRGGDKAKMDIGFYHESGGGTAWVDEKSFHADKDDTEYMVSYKNVDMPPWMLKTVWIKYGHDVNHLGLRYIDIICEEVNGNQIFYKRLTSSSMWLREKVYEINISGANRYISKNFLADITTELTEDLKPVYIGKVDREVYNKPKGTDKSRGIFINEPIYITDQYGTYNPMDYSGNPGEAMLTFDITKGGPNAGNARAEFEDHNGFKMENGKFSFYPHREFYDAMEQYSVDEVKCNFTWTFPVSGTNGQRIFKRSIIYRRKAFNIDEAILHESTAETVKTGDQKLYFFNINKDKPKITLTIDNKVGANNDNLAENFKGKVSLHAGNIDNDGRLGDKICDLIKIEPVSGNKITFVPDTVDNVIPANFTTEDKGLYLNIEDATSANGNKESDKGFPLVSVKDSPTIGKYFEKYRIDTIAPTVNIVNENNGDKESSIIGELNKNRTHKFYITSSEAIRGGIVRYSLLDKDDSLNLKGYQEGSNQTSTEVSVPVSTAVDLDAKITLALADKREGVYTLKIKGEDEALNKMEKTIANVYMDNKAPEASIANVISNNEQDGSKRYDFEFDIRDFSESAKLYYCFVKDGRDIPPRDGEISGEDGPWYFKDWKSNQSDKVTASYKVAKDEDFTGKLHYYVEDKFGNSSYEENGNKYSEQDFAIYNADVKGNIEVEGILREGKPSYAISFNSEDVNEKLSYRWVETNDVKSGFVQEEFKVYSGEVSIGSNKHKGDDGKDYVFDGNYSLEYEIENISKTVDGTLNFIFDNSYPEIDLPTWTNGQKISDSQQAAIKISDKGGVKEAQYKIIDTNNNHIDGLGYINLPISNGRVDTSVNVSVPEDFGNGIYGIEIKAEDNNGNIKIVKHNYVEETGKDDTLKDSVRNASYYNKTDMRFGIRRLPPEVVTEGVTGLDGNTILSSGEGDDKAYITGNSNYSFKIKTTEEFRNASSLGYNTYLKYQASKDGLNWSYWEKAEEGSSLMNRNENGYYASTVINNPVVLSEGINTIYIRTACFESEEGTTTSEKLISSPTLINIELDKSKATYDLSYDKTYRTKETVYGTLEIYNNNPLKTYTVQSDTTGIVIEKERDNPNIFKLTIEKNVNGTLSILDNLGNKTENINVNVDWIDKDAPSATVSSNILEEVGVRDGRGRDDRKFVIKVDEAMEHATRFALLDGGDDTLTEVDFEKFSLMERDGHIKLSSTSQETDNGEVIQTYTIRIMGLTGDYKLGYSSEDTLGNKAETIIADSVFFVTDAELNVVETKFNPMITKSTTVATVKFNVPVAILPLAEVTSNSAINEQLAADYARSPENLKLEYEFVYDDDSIRSYYVSDEIGRSKEVTVSAAGVKFIEGFGSNISYELNGVPITPASDKWIGIKRDGDLKVFINPKSEYTGKQYFYVTSSSAINGEIGDARINKDLSTFVANNIEELAGEELYSRLVFDILVNGRNIKQLEFESYTAEGIKGEERKEREYIHIENVDETPPVVTWTLSTEEATNSSVRAYIYYSDGESSVAKVEAKFNDGNYEDVNISGSGGRTEKVLYERDDILYIKVTNHAGLVSTEAAIKALNIDKTPIEEGRHYKVEYYYENYLGEYLPVDNEKHYRRIKAVIEPITNEEVIKKTLLIANNKGSFEYILENDVAFTFNIEDTAGNEKSQQVKYNKFDKVAPLITEVYLSNSGKTNQPVTVNVKAEDNINAIVHCEAYYKETKLTTEKVSDGLYKFTAENSGIYTIYVWDEAGNKGQRDYTVSNINNVAPELIRTEYSVAPSAKTNQYVMVTLKEFDKQNVRLTGNITSVSSSFDLSNIILYINERSLRFKDNGSVNVEFIDEYGNIGIGLVTVDNIKKEPPQCEAVFELAENYSHATIKFKSMIADTGQPLEPDLNKIRITSGIVGSASQNARDTEIKVNENGLYKFVLSDEVGNIQNVFVTVAGIDKEPPKVTNVSWKYDYSERENQEWSTKTEEGSHTPENQKGYSISKDDGLPETNKDVEVILETDKEVIPIGTKGEAKKEVTVKYTDNGVFSFDLEAVNDTSVLYGVSVDLIDKSKPVIQFNNSDELIFIKDDTRSESKYDKSKLYDFKAYDYDDKDNLIELPAENVEINFISNDRTFNPDNIGSNEFNRSKPYYITYKAYDHVGNETSVTRTVRLIGPMDTLALIDGSMPNANNISSVNKDNFTVSLKNHSGKMYVKYLSGMNTMGEMKYVGKAVNQDSDGKYTIDNLSSGWYTVNVQTDKKDFFNIHVYVNSEK